MAAQEALANAARAMRNALRDLYERQVRHHWHHVYDLDVPLPESAATP